MKKYIHTIGIVKESINIKAKKTENFIPIIIQETNIQNLIEPQFADIPPQNVYEIREQYINIAFWVEPWGKGVIFLELISVKVANFSPSSLWRIGVKFDNDNVGLVLEEDEYKQQFVNWELTNLIIKIEKDYERLKQEIELKLSDFSAHYRADKKFIDLFLVRNDDLIEKLEKQIQQIRNLNQQLNSEQQENILKKKLTYTHFQVKNLTINTYQNLLKLDNKLRVVHENYEANQRKSRIFF